MMGAPIGNQNAAKGNDIKYEEGEGLGVNKKSVDRPSFQNTNKKNQPSKLTGNALPDHEMIEMLPNKAIGMVKDNMNIRVSSLPDGNFQIHHTPQWGSDSKEFHGSGKDLTSLITEGLKRVENSDKAIKAAKDAKFNNSVLGMLKKEYGDYFSTAHSTQSKSEYITHDPSGTKIRISDHDLPLHYEKPDIDLRKHQSSKEQFEIIKKHLSPKES